MFEVEKRSLLKNEQEFQKLKKYLDSNAEFLVVKEMVSFLFREPNYLRIRLIRGNDKAVITIKEGEYTDAARKEVEEEVNINKLDKYIQRITKEGYSSCSEVRTQRYSYRLDGLNVELNRIDYLGLIIEIEALTDDESKVLDLEKKIWRLMKKLKLAELSGETYQQMLNSMYSKTLKRISEHSFRI
ncbi:MAG: CYTH domain-containing protein [archaeon]